MRVYVYTCTYRVKVSIQGQLEDKDLIVVWCLIPRSKSFEIISEDVVGLGN